MSTGNPADPVCRNITTAKIASPPGVRRATAVIDPVCRVLTTGDDQYTAPPPPPSR